MASLVDNCTNSFVNITPLTNFTSTPQWTSFTARINSTVGCTIGWFVNATDDAGNINNTDSSQPFSFITSSLMSTPTTPFYPNQIAIRKDSSNNIHITFGFTIQQP